MRKINPLRVCLIAGLEDAQTHWRCNNYAFSSQRRLCSCHCSLVAFMRGQHDSSGAIGQLLLIHRRKTDMVRGQNV